MNFFKRKEIEKAKENFDPCQHQLQAESTAHWYFKKTK